MTESKSWRVGLAALCHNFALAFCFLALATICSAQENHPPSVPGAITISEITAHSARISWVAATDADGDALAYQVWLRKRIGGVAQAWSDPRTTTGTTLIWDGLSAGTTYDVKIVASDGKTTGLARIQENAFITLNEATENHPPTLPGDIQVTNVTAHSARLAWGASTDPDGDVVTYQVSLRQRTDGTVSDWLPACAAQGTSLVWDGLSSESIYDVRVRAFDGKSFSDWRISENAFQTTPETSAPSKPGEISVTEVTATSAHIAWQPSTGPAGAKLVYSVQIRARVNGVAQSWQGAGETTNTWIAVTGLPPGTFYDVQVRAWAMSVAGAWMLKENAFQTLAVTEVNHAPSVPGPLAVSDLTPYSVRLSWGASADSDGDAITYAICLRKRVEGVAQPWSAAREVQQPSIVWDGLSPNTIYEVRIRAWDGKAASDWYLKEGAFQTPAPTRLASYQQPSDPAQPGSTQLILAWPNAGGPQVLETADSLNASAWTQCQEVETDGVQSRTVVPMNSNARFFRIR